MRPSRHPRHPGTHTAGVLVALVALVVFGGAAGANTGEAEDWYDDYVAGDFGRVRHVENGLEIERAEAEPTDEREAGGINAPILPGDLVSTAGDERAEIQLAGGSLIRIDRASEVTFLSMPDPYAEIADTTVLQLSQGTLRLAIEIEDNEEFRIDTPAASIYALADADMRVEVGRSGRTRVWSRRGTIEVVGDGASVLLRTGSETEVHPGLAPDEPWAFNTFASDGFDLWVAEREAAYRDVDGGPDSRVVYEALPNEVRPYYSELSRHGRWTQVPEYGYVWSPSTRAVDWRPYNAGYWRHGPRGYFWVSHEPWGWAPYHYGRWNYLADYGWCWSPGRVFGGAWVSWSWGSLHVGWSPLDYWNRPAYVRQVHHHYYDPYAWTFVHYNHFTHRDYRHWSVPLAQVRHELPRHAVAVRPARVSPARLANSPEARREAVAQVHADVRRPLPAGKAVNNGRSFDRVETRLTSEGVRDASVRGAKARRTGSPAADRRTAERTAPRFPSRIRSGRSGAIDGTAVSTTPTRRTAPRAGRAGDVERTTPRVQPIERGRRVDQRVRDIYRRVAAPRESRESVDRRRGERTTTRQAPSADSGARSGRETPRADERPAAEQRSETPRAERPARTRGGSSGADRPARTREGGDSSERSRPSRGSSDAKPKPRADRDGDRSNASARVPTRPSTLTRGRSTTPTRSTASSRRVSAPTRSSANVRRVNAPTRPTAAPRRNTTPSRSTATSRRTNTPTRPSANSRRTNAPTRSTATPRRSSAPSRPTASPRRTTSPTRTRATSSRPSAPTRPTATRGRSSAPAPRPKAAPRRSSPPKKSTSTRSGGSSRSGSSSRSKPAPRRDRNR